MREEQRDSLFEREGFFFIPLIGTRPVLNAGRLGGVMLLGPIAHRASSDAASGDTVGGLSHPRLDSGRVSPWG